MLTYHVLRLSGYIQLDSGVAWNALVTLVGVKLTIKLCNSLVIVIIIIIVVIINNKCYKYIG